jgi:hypothetical protein
MNLVILLVVLIILYAYLKKSTFINQIVKDVYKPEDCSYVENNRVYPSGHVPGSYLGLSEQEKEYLLKRFIDEKPDAFNESN